MTIRSRKHPVSRYVAALAMLTVAAPAAAYAFDTPPDTDHPRDEVLVTGKHEKYKVDKVSSLKKTEALIDTPQTVAVIKRELLQEQNATTLTDALRNTPGITMQLGENGNTSAGDTFQLRGFSAQSSVFLDGIRDLGAVSRDVFNVEQVEVAKGAAGSDIGRGASAGYINLVSKLPALEHGDYLTVSGYSQGGARASLDTSFRLGKTSAARLNLMDQDINVAGRSFVKNSGYGIAPSYAIGLGTDTRFYVFAQVLHQDNVPDGGISVIGYPGFFNANAAIKAGARVDRDNFYGSPNDHEKVDADLLTSKIEHDFAGGVRFTNTMRYGQNTMNRVLTGIGTNASSGITAPSADPSTWIVNRSRQRVDQDNHILANTTNFTTSLVTGSWTHDISSGVELDYESQRTVTFALATGVTAPAANLYHPNTADVLPIPLPNGAYSDGNSTTVSGYVFDTAKHGPWLLSAGLRVDNYTIRTNGATLTTSTSNPPLPAGVLLASSLKDGGTIASWNLGVVYKPRHNGSIYISYGDSLTPPGSANFTLSATSSNIANSAFKPTETDNLEIGTKWDLFHEHLSVTAAAYDTKAKNELALQDPVTLSYSQVGEREVSGIELGLVGQITPQWQVTAGLQTMHTEVIDGNSATGTGSAGASTRWSPELTATFWTTYKLTKRLTVGGGASYTSDQKLVVDKTAVVQTASSVGLARIPKFWVANAMASYDLSRRLELQLNVYNLFNEDYISSLNNGGARVFPGQPLTGTLSLNVKF